MIAAIARMWYFTLSIKIREVHYKCSEPVLFDEVTEGYYAYCPFCDEDLYTFEIIKEEY